MHELVSRELTGASYLDKTACVQKISIHTITIPTFDARLQIYKDLYTKPDIDEPGAQLHLQAPTTMAYTFTCFCSKSRSIGDDA
jgi:hypothetical protein